MLEQTTAGQDPFEDGPGFLQRLFTPREWAFSNPDRAFQAAYRWGGWLLFSLPGLVILSRRCRGRRADLPASGADPPRHAVCGRPPAGLGRRRLPARPAGRGGGARGRARTDGRLLRAQGAAGRRQADPDLPVRLRRHLGRLVRAPSAPDRGHRGRPRHRPDPGRRGGSGLGRDVRDLGRPRLPGRAGRLYRRPLQPQPAARPRRVPHPGRPAAPAGPAGPLAAAAGDAPGGPVGAARHVPRGRPVCRRGAGLVAGLRGLCHTDVAPATTAF